MNYSRGDIVIVPFPFIISGKQKIQKARPALVISEMTIDISIHVFAAYLITSNSAAISTF